MYLFLPIYFFLGGIEIRRWGFVLTWVLCYLPVVFFHFIKVIYNRETDRSRGFGFVTMSTVEEAEQAVEKFHRYVSFFFVSSS